MPWITVIWSMVSAACVTLAVTHWFTYLRDRSRGIHFCIGTIALSIAAISAAELALMKSTTTHQFGEILRWAHVPIFTLVVSIVVLVRLHLTTGRKWLAWAVCVSRGLSLLINLFAEVNTHYTRIDAIKQIRVLGETVTVVADAQASPLMAVPIATTVLLLIFVIDAAIRSVRQGNSRHAVYFCIATIISFLTASLLSAFVHLGTFRVPYFVAISCLPLLLTIWIDVVLVMGRTSKQSRELQAQAAKLEYEQRFRLGMEALPVGILFVTPDGRIELANDAAATIFGYDKRELAGLPLDALVPNPKRAEHRDNVARFFADPGVRIMGREVACYRKSGEEIWLDIGLSSVDTAGGRRAIASISDITKIKSASNELTQQRNEMAHISRVNMLGELSGSLAHELNQPLASILSNAEAAQRLLDMPSVETKDMREIMDDIVAANKRAAETIRHLRSLYTKGEIERQPLNLNELVSNVLKLLNSDLNGHSLQVTTHLYDEPTIINGDSVQLQQVLINLLMNASEAMRDTAPDARHLCIETELRDGSEVHLRVKDSGQGIATEQLKRVFIPFVSSKARGMGLGLAVCRTIVIAHNGKIWMTRNEDRGVCVHVSLPYFSGDNR